MNIKTFNKEKLQTEFMRFKKPIIFGYIVGLLAFTYTFCNKLVQWDEIFYSFSKGASLEAGRWGLDILQYIFPNYSMPWLWGVISLTFLIIAACLIIDLFKLENVFYQCLLVGLVVAFPSMISAYAYMFQSVTYSFGVLLCVVALVLSIKKDIRLKVVGILGFTFAFSIYQAFISIVLSFYIVFIIKELLDGEKDAVRIFKQGLQYICYVVIALILYLAITVTLFLLKDLSLDLLLNRTEGEEPMGLFMRFLYTYLYFAGYFVNGTAGIMPTLLSVVCHVSAMLALLVCCIKFIITDVDKYKKGLFILMLSVFPMAVNAIIFISTGTHTLMVYSFVATYVLAFILLEKQGENHAFPKISTVIKRLFPISMLLIIAANIYTANLVSLRMTYSNQAFNAFYTELSTQIKMCEGYTQGDRIAIVGETDELRYNVDKEFDKFSLVGTNALDVNIYSRKQYIKYYLGNDFDFLSHEEIEENILPLPEYQEMAIYPYDGSVKRVNGYIIVKLGQFVEE